MNATEIKAVLTQRWPDNRYLHVYEAPLDSSRQGGAIDVMVMSLWHSDRHERDAVEIKVSYSDWCKEWRRIVWVVTDHNQHTVVHDRRPSDRDLNHYRGYLQLTDEWVQASRRRYPLPDPPPDDFEPTVERVQQIDTSKNAAFRKACHRFWVAAPDGLAQKIKADIETIPELAGWGVLAVTEREARMLIKPTTNHTCAPLTPGQWLGIVRAAADSGVQAIFRAEERGRREGRAAAMTALQHQAGAA